MRYFIEIAYHGAAFHGWQVQPNAHSVQAELTEKFSLLLGHAVKIVGSGRTDTGVHCRQQFAHFDTDAVLNPERFLHKANAFLPPSVSVASLRPVVPDAHARFSALSRTYEYWLTTRKDPLMPGLVLYCFQPLDFGLMNQAAALLIQHDDFRAFSKTHTDVTHFTCRIDFAYWEQQADRWVFRIRANRFLRGMVRLIVGTLLEVGQHRLSVDDFGQRIAARSQGKQRTAAPAHGLYLTAVEYPPEIFLELPA